MVNYLINLDRETRRLDHMRREFGRLGLEFSRIPATDGATLSAETIEAFSPYTKIGHIGCFLSHVAAWRQIADGGEAVAAIFEDDIHLSSLISPFLSNFRWLPNDADIVRLETMGNGMRLGRPAAEYQGVAIRPVYARAWGTAGYVIRREVAKRLAACSQLHCPPIDYFLFNASASAVARTLRVYQLDPALCMQDWLRPANRHSLGFESATGSEPSARTRRHMIKIFRPVARKVLGRTPVPFAG
jgi:glycosyl transferase, family 25